MKVCRVIVMCARFLEFQEGKICATQLVKMFLMSNNECWLMMIIFKAGIKLRWHANIER